MAIPIPIKQAGAEVAGGHYPEPEAGFGYGPKAQQPLRDLAAAVEEAAERKAGFIGERRLWAVHYS